MAVIPAGFAQVNLRFSGSAVPLGAEITFGVENSTPLTADTIADTVGDVIAGTDWDGYWPNTMGLASILVKLGPNATGASAELAYAIAGTSFANAEAPNVAALVTKVTASGGRRGKGRFFQPVPAEAIVATGGLLDSAWQAGLQSELANFLADMSTAGLPLVVLHSYPYTWTLVGGVPKRDYDTGAALPVPTPITSLNVAQRVASQRRRNRR